MEAKDPVEIVVFVVRKPLEDIALGQLRIVPCVGAKMRRSAARHEQERREPVEAECHERDQDELELPASRGRATLALGQPTGCGNGQRLRHAPALKATLDTQRTVQVREQAPHADTASASYSLRE